MKKIVTTLVMLIALNFAGNAQYWYIPYINAGHNPGSLNNDTEQPGVAGWTIIQTTSATPVYSTVQTLPFTFTLNGTPFTSYKVSTSGVLTFTTGATTPPSSTSASLPDPSIPNNSICIWGLAATGSNDNIVTKTFGTAPNRQFWVQFNSYSCPVISGGFSYWAIVMEETTNNVYVVDQRTYNATPALAIGIQANSTTAYQVTGSPNIGSQATAQASASPSDNTYYQFMPGTQPANDIALQSISPAQGSQAGYGAQASTKTISGVVQNLGSSAITSFIAKYNDGSGPVASTFSSLNIAPFATYTFTCTTPYTLATASATPLKVWVELTSDPNHNDDTLKTTVTGYSFLPSHNVVLEEATGTWCGWCPRGAVYMDSMSTVHPNTTVLIAVHNSDPMTDTPYDAGVGTSIAGYPSILVDRNIVDDPSNAFVQYAAHINDFGMADLTVTPTYNNISRVATIAVTAHMACSFPNTGSSTNDFRLAVVFTEMGVTGSGSTWDQHDYYSSTSNNLPLSGAGHNWQTEPNPVPSARMKYDFVDRAIIGGYRGMPSSLPATITAGSTYSQNFTYTVPAGYNAGKMKAHALLIDATNNIIYNGKSTSTFLSPLGVNSIVANKQEFSVFPNPATSNLNMNLKLQETDNQVVVSFVNFLGQTVKSENLGRVVAGENTFSFDVSNLPSGAYFVTVTTSAGTASSKFIK